MSSELERRLEGLLAELPEPEPDVGERALATSLAALWGSAPRRRGLRTVAVAFAAAFVLLAIAAGSLAAVGALHVSLGTKPRRPPTHTQLSLPRGADGIAVVVDGELSVVTRTGFRLQGLRVSAAALSPHALYVAAGIGDSLVALAPDGRRAWSYPAGGSVVAIAWAPFGNRIAYVVRAGRQLVLHVIWGNGRNDAVIDRSVRAVRPSWRGDSLAFAYVGAGGKAIVYDLAHAKRHVIDSRGRGAVRQVAFATGNLLAVETKTQVVVVRPGLNQVEDHGRLAGLGWTGRWFAVAHVGPRPVILLTMNPQTGVIPLAGAIQALGADGHGLAVAVDDGAHVRVLAARSGDRLRPVLQLPERARVSYVQLG